VRKRSLSHLSDSDLLQAFAAINCRDRATLAELLEHLVELDQRRLYAPAGYRSMFAFCTERLHWSEDVAFKRIRAARTMWQFDDVVTAPLHGFAGAEDYWRRASSKPWLRAIGVPVLVLNARNDPFIPASSLATRAEVSEHVLLEQPGDGGHAGFPAGPFPGHVGWLPRRLLHFFDYGL